MGNYRLSQFVGAGKIGYVYQANHEELTCVRAVKLTFDTLKSGWENELNKVAKLALIPGVVPFHECGTAQLHHEGDSRLCQYTVWDYIDPGDSLADYLKRVKRIPASFLIAVVEQTLHVLHACGERGVPRHGDLHPGNILIGSKSLARLDSSLQLREAVFVSDFGYGATGLSKPPKDDYEGLKRIINRMIPCVDYSTATGTDRLLLRDLRNCLGKLLSEPAGPDRRPPLDLLRVLLDLKGKARAGDVTPRPANIVPPRDDTATPSPDAPGVGQFLVSEMIGDRWDWWQRLFVPTVPARSRILGLDIPTVLTGPRGCGKTMLLRRLSERLIVECGPVAELSAGESFVALYVNANDFADAFSRYPELPSEHDESRLTCYANLCTLSDLLTVQSARVGRYRESPSPGLLDLVQQWLVPSEFSPLVVGEDRLERYRTVLEGIKWSFPSRAAPDLFPGYSELSQHRWLRRFVQEIRNHCPWVGDRHVLLFVDDFSVPRVSASMQRVLNRLFLQRSPEFVAKIATEAWSTFVPEDASGKNLQDGDDYQLVDMGEESLFLPDADRIEFLGRVFRPRLGMDHRVSDAEGSLEALLGRMPLSKTEFARRLRSSIGEDSSEARATVKGKSQRRGRSRPRVYYCGDSVFAGLWSGDTRTMIQLVSDLLDQAPSKAGHRTIDTPIDEAIQDRVFRNRGGEWLNSHTRNEPTDPEKVKEELARIQAREPQFGLRGEYGDHLKAIVEAFVAAARALLVGPAYRIREGRKTREVPRMAFRLEILDEFRLDGLAQEIYRDLIRYGIFLRDNRGKSVRGNFVPRLYLRRLLLPYCTLALSRRDSVPLSCANFKRLLLDPDGFRESFAARRVRRTPEGQTRMPLFDGGLPGEPDPSYDDLGDA